MNYTEEIKKVFDDRKELFVAKNENYGNSWVKTGQILELIFGEKLPKINKTNDYIAFGVLVRMLDKIVRYATMRFTGEKDKVGEARAETSGDLGVYAFMLESLEKQNEKETKNNKSKTGRNTRSR